MADFVHLHVKTGYSREVGILPLSRLMETVAALGQKAVAVTDTAVLHALPAFFRLANQVGIAPIAGCRLEVIAHNLDVSAAEMACNLTLLCRNKKGWNNLRHLVTLAHTGANRAFPQISLEDLAQNREGLIVLSGGHEGQLTYLLRRKDGKGARKLVKEMHRLFKESYYLELQNHGLDWQQTVNEQLTELGEREGIGSVATNGVAFVTQEEAHQWNALRHGRGELPNVSAYLKSADEMASAMEGWSQAVANTVEIARQCQGWTEEGKLYPGVTAVALNKREEVVEALQVYCDQMGFPLRKDVTEGEEGTTVTLLCRPQDWSMTVDVLESGTNGLRGYRLCRWLPLDNAHVVREAGLAARMNHEEPEALVRLLPRRQEGEDLSQAHQLWEHCRNTPRLNHLLEQALWLQQTCPRPRPHPSAILLTAAEEKLPLFQLDKGLYPQFDLAEAKIMGLTLLFIEPSQDLAMVEEAAAWLGIDPATIATGEELTSPQAILARQREWLLVNHPIYAMAAMLNSHPYLRGVSRKLKAHGVTMLCPDVNLSEYRYLPSRDGIRFPLSKIRNVSHTLAAQIITSRGEEGLFTSFGDFCRRIPLAQNTAAMESLIRSGALDCFASRTAMLDFWEREENRSIPTGLDVKTLRLPYPDETPRHLLCHQEWEETGYYFTDHPMNFCVATIARLGAIPVGEALPLLTADLGITTITIAGVVTSCRMHRTKGDKLMAFTSIEDEGSAMDVLFFEETLGSAGSYLQIGIPLAVTGKVSRAGEIKIIGNSVAPLTESADFQAMAAVPQPALWIRVEDFDHPILEQVRQVLQRYPGTGRVYLYSKSRKKSVLWNKVFAATGDELALALKAFCGEENVALRYTDCPETEDR